MSISALSSMTAGSPGARLVPGSGSGFGSQVTVAVGQGRGSHAARGHRTQETGTPDAAAPAAATPPARSMADDARALVGDVFGALGADTPSAVNAQQAIAAYRRAG